MFSRSGRKGRRTQRNTKVSGYCNVISTPNSIMKIYLTYAPISLLLIWLYLVIDSFKSLKHLKKISGKSYFNLMNPLLLLKSFRKANETEEFEEAYQKHKRNSRKHLIIWVVSIAIFIIVTFVVGILTATPKN
ncbi:MAG: hypothetical protein IPP73_18070 [Chitinophagaceae bacterium]|nr:hypothetical protein [Chitinophagaceae bacterium]